MPRFLFAAWPISGHYFPLLSVAKVLQERGHDCALYTGPEGGSAAKAEGLLWFPFRSLDDQWFRQLIYQHTFSPIRPIQIIQLRKRVARLILKSIPAQVEDVKRICGDWQPDVIVTETMMWGPYLILHEHMGIPVAVFSTVPACIVPGSDVPPFGFGLPPPRDWHTRLLNQVVSRAMRLVSRSVRRKTNRIRREFGLSDLTISGVELAGKMPLYLVPTVREFDYNRKDLPPSVHYVGLCQWTRPSGSNRVDTSRIRPDGRPCIHVTEGTIHVRKPLVIHAAMEGLANLPMRVIITIGPNRELEDMGFRHIPANVQVEKFLPHEDLMPHVDVLVTTGGGGTVHAALSAGVPMVVVPTEWDKYDNAQRIVGAGVGVRLSARRCTPKTLRGAVERVLKDPTYRNRAKHFADLFSKTRGSEQAAELLEALAEGRSMRLSNVSNHRESMP